LLVHVGRAQHAVLVLHRGQRYGASNLRPGTPRRVHDLAGGLVEYAIVVRLQADPNSFFANHVSFLSKILCWGWSAFPPSALRLLPPLMLCPTFALQLG